jgi:hypothetical protein
MRSKQLANFAVDGGTEPRTTRLGPHVLQAGHIGKALDRKRGSHFRQGSGYLRTRLFGCVEAFPNGQGAAVIASMLAHMIDPAGRCAKYRRLVPGRRLDGKDRATFR